MFDPMIFLWALIGPVVSLIIAFPITVITKDNSLVDIGWVLGFVSMPWIGYIITGLNNPGTWLSARQLTINILVTIWGIRLLTHYIVRKIIRKTEDERFASFREEWKENFYLKTILIIFTPQVFLVYIIGSAATFANAFVDTYSMGTVEYILLIIGAIVWLEGFLLESISDFQLLKFRKNPENKGKILNTGLWKYSRHPNYFGEAEQWWGIFIIAISYAFTKSAGEFVTSYLVAGWLTILGPILLAFILLKVSGINTLEKDGILKGREGYDEYLETTSAFIPWFPKKKKS
jgi:steroid 5-alpha reductase family enzyme